MTDSSLQGLPQSVDLKNADHLRLVDQKVDELVAKYRQKGKLEALEKELLAGGGPTPVFALLVLKVAKSRLVVEELKDHVTVSVVMAVYKEHNRIRPNHEHPHGEDFLRRKASQLETLLGDQANLSWRLIVVDDGCPEGSGRIAEEIVRAEGMEDRVQVCFLEQAIGEGVPAVKALNTTDDSQKGGSIIYGMWHASQQPADGEHVIIYTDADLSTHLGQVGLLLEPIMKEKRDVAIGSRREPDSVVVKQGTRNDRGKLFIYLWKRMVPVLGDIIDTQCGFKAFRQETLKEILDDLLEYRFAFDIELLLRTALGARDRITKVPLAWIDSEEASTTTDIQPYLPMLRSIAAMYRTYLPPEEAREEFAAFIEELDEEGFDRLVADIPSALLEKEPHQLGDFDGVSADDLRGRIS